MLNDVGMFYIEAMLTIDGVLGNFVGDNFSQKSTSTKGIGKYPCWNDRNDALPSRTRG